MSNIKYKSIYRVFSNVRYILLALLTASIYLLIAILVPSLSVIKFFWSSGMSIFALAKLAIVFYISNSTNTTRVSVLIIAILSGLNISMLVFYFNRRIRLQKDAGVGFLGMIIGLLGIGCTSCGSVILSAIFGLTAATSFLRILPFKGSELGVLSILLLLLSIYILSIKIENPFICKIDTNKRDK